MIAAIDAYNKPDSRYRAESFTILAVNAWELLLKAKWLLDHSNRRSSLYVRTSSRSNSPYKRTRSGNPMTLAIDHLAKKLTESGAITEPCRRNLEALIELRDTSVHFYHHSPKFEEHLLEVGMGSLKNFVSAVQDWFDADLSQHNFYLMPLSFVSAPKSVQAITLSREEDGFVRYLRSLIEPGADPAARYAVAINVETRFIRSKTVSATPVRSSNDPSAVPVVLTEEQVRERYPWDYRELTDRCSKRYAGFKENQLYHERRKPLEVEPRLVNVRRLDPGNPKSSSKKFYSSAVLEELDKLYTLK
ncbi:MAG: DUF3644 domain-containing protein [Fimbriimonadaceae bacterium]|nr:DUF3644 domain-containing protein [Fimbriimonadaceae bacterium]QYK55162.1 MAG: DUF3644 domain-containing protein [Fimbriimonadaceae bacterium]